MCAKWRAGGIDSPTDAMLLKALNSREASRVGAALADGFSFTIESAPGDKAVRRQNGSPNGSELDEFLQSFLKRVDQEARALRLNILNRAIIANSFKWRLLEKGVERETVSELTQALVVRLSSREEGKPAPEIRSADPPVRRNRNNIERLLAQADKYAAQGDYAEAIERYEQLLTLEPRHAVAHNNLGVARNKLGHYREAEEHFRRAIALKKTYAEAHCNLGTLLRLCGQVAESEAAVRRALELKPADVNAQLSLGATLLLLRRPREAKELFEKVVRLAPRNLEALASLGHIAALEGRIADAEATLKNALDLEPRFPAAAANLIRLRRMTRADSALLKAVEAGAGHRLPPHDEATLRYAIGKYCDDVGDYERAFSSYQRANELQKAAARPYDRDAHRRGVDDLIRVYTRDTLCPRQPGSSDSMRPVLVVGMPRSGTTLVVQIIASHGAARGAGELAFWSEEVRKRQEVLRRHPPSETLRRKLGAAYLRELARCGPDALRVVDKMPSNSDFLGLIHSVFPNARMIYLRRDPIDSCLSCYFQSFPVTTNFAMDLSDLAHYYREHQRLIAHWRSALPPETLLDVPYEALVEKPEEWSRRIIDFIGLEWDPRCLDFHSTERTVMTASYAQVRQKIYRRAVGRWRNYRKFIGPLLELRDEGN
jgi:tetratricopeptide (TPR) repeat protein